jgi:hypothetical protein
MAAVWTANPIEVELDEEEIHRKGSELAQQLRKLAEQVWPEIFASLTEKGKSLFVIDLLKALADAEGGDKEAVARVGEAWWRTRVARTDYLKNLKVIGKGKVYTRAELKAALKL